MTLAAALWLAFLAVIAPAATPELDAYAKLARDRSASAQVLEAARFGLATELGLRRADGVTPVPDWPGSPRPVYVTLVRGRTTRACVGSDSPLGGTLAATLMRLGEQLANSDRRRPPVSAGELDTLRLVVAFAGDPVAVSDPMLVDPVREGLKIESSRGAVAFLPGEARTIAWALREARRIGVLAGPASDARYSRFRVVVVSGPASVRSFHP